MKSILRDKTSFKYILCITLFEASYFMINYNFQVIKMIDIPRAVFKWTEIHRNGRRYLKCDAPEKIRKHAEKFEIHYFETTARRMIVNIDLSGKVSNCLWCIHYHHEGTTNKYPVLPTCDAFPQGRPLEFNDKFDYKEPKICNNNIGFEIKSEHSTFHRITGKHDDSIDSTW